MVGCLYQHKSQVFLTTLRFRYKTTAHKKQQASGIAINSYFRSLRANKHSSHHSKLLPDLHVPLSPITSGVGKLVNSQIKLSHVSTLAETITMTARRPAF